MESQHRGSSDRSKWIFVNSRPVWSMYSEFQGSIETLKKKEKEEEGREICLQIERCNNEENTTMVSNQSKELTKITV